MASKKFHVNVREFELATKACGDCAECYVEQLWRDIGDESCSHCQKTKAAFQKAFKKVVPENNENGLPQKDVLIVAVLKDGKHVCVKLFYDNEGKPCMYYDDFDNWYSICDVTFVTFVLPQYIDIEVDS